MLSISVVQMPIGTVLLILSLGWHIVTGATNDGGRRFPKSQNHKSYRDIKNLADIINAIVRRQNYLIILESFELVNVPLDFSKAPLLLRSLVYSRDNYSQPRWFPRGMLNKQSIIDQQRSDLNSSLQCPVSNFFVGLDRERSSEDHKFCLTIKLYRFSPKTKPWKYHLHLLLYPPREDVHRYPEPFIVLPKRKGQIIHLETFTICPVLIFVSHSNLQENTTIQHIKAWLHHVIFSPSHLGRERVVIDFFFWMKVKSVEVEEITGKIDNVDKIQIFDSKESLYKQISVESDGLQTLQHFTTKSSLNNKVLDISWEIITRTSSQHEFYSVLNDCQRFSSHLRYPVDLWKNPMFAFSSTNKMAYSYVHLILALAKNFSFDTKSVNYETGIKINKCINGKSEVITRHTRSNSEVLVMIQFIVDSESLAHYPLVVEDKVTNLRFVSCSGSKGKHALPFGELISAFQFQVWFYIILTILVTATGLAIISRKAGLKQCGFTFTDGIIRTMKILSEQGNPFPDKSLKRIPTRILVGVYLVFGIVLSNAYKNRNVYNMITPRTTVFYETIREFGR